MLQQMYIIPGGAGRQNVRNIIYVPRTDLNASADPTAVVCSNHVLMNQIDTVSTEAVCPSRKSTVCSSPCTNINNMSMYTSTKLPSKNNENSQASQKSV